MTRIASKNIRESGVLVETGEKMAFGTRFDKFQEELLNECSCSLIGV